MVVYNFVIFSNTDGGYSFVNRGDCECSYIDLLSFTMLIYKALKRLCPQP